jgi:two-component system alkaline phosphatase synthesis response regulator PhoP
MARILVVEDEQDLQKVLEYNLKQAGHEPIAAMRGRDALELVRARRPDAVLLDLMLPDLPGTEVCRALKADPATRSIPVIMLTAKGEEIDRVVGFELGADDYVVKPFSPAELVARVHAVLRRVQREDNAGSDAGPITVGDVVVDARERSVSVAGKPVELTAKEFDLLLFLARHLGQVFTRDELMDSVWRYPFYTDTATVTVHVRRVRQKIEADPLMPKHLLTVWGVGYKLTA